MSPKAINNRRVSFPTNRLWLISADWHTLQSDQIICFSLRKCTRKCQCPILGTQNSISNNNIWPSAYRRETNVSFGRFRSPPRWAIRANIFTTLPLCLSSPVLLLWKVFFPLIFFPPPPSVFGREPTGGIKSQNEVILWSKWILGSPYRITQWHANTLAEY